MGSEKYIMIYDWMLQLGLNPSELLAFGLVFRYTSHGAALTASSETFSKWLGIHPYNALKVMDRLAEKELIIKTTQRKGSAKYCTYITAPRFSTYYTTNETFMATTNKTFVKNENKNKKEEKTATPSLYDLARMSNVKN